MIRLAIAEDHNSFIEGIELFLEFEDDITIVGIANNGRELLDIVRKKSPNVVITDIRMPIMDGVEVAKKIISEYPKMRIIAFTMFDQDGAVSEMLNAGVSGYILKNSSLSVLLSAIRIVHKGENFYDPNVLSEKPKTNKLKGKLTNRQMEILKLIVEGKSNPEIAEILFIERTTVETHRKNMVRKLGLSGSGELLRYGLQKRYEF
ncbi:response regulator transcription factor [Aquimarina sp. 2201CG1-2-11]|uniref:response regulator n=1 Tax=Aquimarina discodermiae TaxID=3231043 RepID=UPI003461B7EC